MLDGLLPASGKHSITRVIATIFIPQAFLKPEEIFETIKNIKEFSTYQKKTIIKPTTISVNKGSIGVTNDDIAGFIFEEYDKSGRLKNILKLENTRENQSIITIENRTYTDWKDFQTRLIQDIKSLSDKINIYIDAISLTYVDEFIWNKPKEPIDINSIFNSKSELLNTKFKNSKNGTLILISQGVDNYDNYEEKTEISFSNDVRRVVVSHQYAIKLTTIETYTVLDAKGEFIKYFEKAHNANKLVLSDVLSTECQSLINLK